jgi:hypothetical protein
MDDGFYTLYARVAPKLSEGSRVVRDPILNVVVDEEIHSVHIEAQGRTLDMPIDHIPALPTVGGELYYTTDVDQHGFIGWSMPCLFCSYAPEADPKVH